MNLPSPEFFNYRDCVIGGDDCVLIFPKELGVDWTIETLPFRSIILRKSDHKVVSIGQLKFTNLGEKPHLYPDPASFKDWTIWDKLDGSLCIVSRHNGELIVRTRGTASVMVHPDGQEVIDLIKAYGVNKSSFLRGYSLLFEHLSVTRPIVLRYPKSDIVLLDIIRHSDLTYLSTVEVDEVARQLGCKRPERFTFDSINDIVETCLHLKGKEGFVLAYNSNQNRLKIKAADYLLKHRMKSELGSISKVLDLYLTFFESKPENPSFYEYISTTFDFEIAQQVKPFIMDIQIAHSIAESTINDVEVAVRPFRSLSRKEAALSIINQFKESGLSSLAFILLDKKPIPMKTLRELIEKELEKTSHVQTLTQFCGQSDDAFQRHLEDQNDPNIIDPDGCANET